MIKAGFLFPLYHTSIPTTVMGGPELADFKISILPFLFTLKGFGIRLNPFVGVTVFPQTAEDSQIMFKFFKNLVSGISNCPISIEHWKECENYRIEMTANGARQGFQIEGLLHNLWEEIPETDVACASAR